MRNYTDPKMNITKFYVEKISATDATITELPYGYMLSVPDYGTEITNAINNAQQSVSANVSFQDAIKFR